MYIFFPSIPATLSYNLICNSRNNHLWSHCALKLFITLNIGNFPSLWRCRCVEYVSFSKLVYLCDTIYHCSSPWCGSIGVVSNNFNLLCSKMVYLHLVCLSTQSLNKLFFKDVSFIKWLYQEASKGFSQAYIAGVRKVLDSWLTMKRNVFVCTWLSTYQISIFLLHL